MGIVDTPGGCDCCKVLPQILYVYKKVLMNILPEEIFPRQKSTCEVHNCHSRLRFSKCKYLSPNYKILKEKLFSS